MEGFAYITMIYSISFGIITCPKNFIAQSLKDISKSYHEINVISLEPTQKILKDIFDRKNHFPWGGKSVALVLSMCKVLHKNEISYCVNCTCGSIQTR